MYRISKWKLALIIGVFVFSGLYLLPTIPGVYGRLYGYFDIWMQGKIHPPDVQNSKDGEFIRFTIPEGDLPMGVSVQEASESIQEIVGRRLVRLGIGEELKVEEAEEPVLEQSEGEEQRKEEPEKEEKQASSGFSFDRVTMTDLYIEFNEMKSKAELEEIIQKLQLDGDPPPVHRPPDLPGGEHEGSIRFTITKDDFPEKGGVQEALRNVRDKLKEQLEALDLGSPSASMKFGDDFTFSNASRDELYVRFSPQKSRRELEKLMEDLRLYGSLPLKLRPIFPDNPLKQGLDLKGGLHIVLELDVRKAMDIYLDSQAKEVILGSLKREKIFCRSVEKTLEKRGDNMLILRPYAPEDSATGAAHPPCTAVRA